MRDPMSAFDKIITEAQQEGKFENLEGKGKPLVIDTSPDAVVKGLLKEANVSVAPEWITLAMEIDRLLEAEEGALERYAALYEADRAAVLDAAGATQAVEPVREPAREPLLLRWWHTLTRGSDPAASGPRSAEIRQAEQVNALRRRWERELARYAAWLHQINRKISRFNLIVPLANRQHALLPVRERLAAFAARVPLPERAPEGGFRFMPGVVPAELLTPPAEEHRSGRARDVGQVMALQQLRRRGQKPPPIS